MTAGLAAASGLVAAACGVPGATSTQQSPNAAAVSGPLIYRTWWTPSTPPEKTWWEFVKPDFEAKHPGATLELEFIEFGQAYEKFVTSMAGGSLPDVMHGQTGYARDIWDLGALEDLSPFIAKTPSLAMSNFIPASLFYNQIGGKVYGIPHEGPDATILFYNAAHLESVGLDASPKAVDAWSWDDLVQATTKLTRRSGDGSADRIGFAVPALNVRQMGAWLPTQGGSFYNKDQNGVLFDNEKGESVVQMLVDLRNRVGPPLQGSTTDLFLQGKASIISTNMVSISNFSLPQLRPPFNWSVMAFPKGPQGPRRSAAAFVNMDILPKQAKHKDLARAWLTYYTSLEMARARMRLIGRVNPRKEFYDTPEFKSAVASTPQLSRFPEMAAVGNAVPFVRLSQLTRDVEPLLIETGDGKRSPKQGLAEAATLANQILSKPAGAP